MNHKARTTEAETRKRYQENYQKAYTCTPPDTYSKCGGRRDGPGFRLSTRQTSAAVCLAYILEPEVPPGASSGS